MDGRADGLTFPARKSHQLDYPYGILVNIDSGNGLSFVRRQAITWPNADLRLIRPLRTNLIQIYIKWLF